MEYVKIEAEAFDELRVKDTLPGFNSLEESTIYTFYRKYPNQKVLYEIMGNNFESNDVKSFYNGFGIQLQSTGLVRNEADRNYVLIIPDIPKDQLADFCEKFVHDYFPEDELPTHYAYVKTFTSFEEYRDASDAITSIYPSIFPLAFYGTLRDAYHRKHSLLRLNEEVIEANLKTIDISEDLQRVQSSYYNNNYETLQRVQQLAKNVLAQYTGAEVIISSGGDRRLIDTVAAYMYYKHNVVSHLTDRENTTYFSHLRTLYYNEDNMLMEDKLAYVGNLPHFALYSTDAYLSWVALQKNGLRCQLTIRALDMNNMDLADLEELEISYDDLVIIPLLEEFDLSGTDVSTVHRELLDIFRKLEERLNLFDTTVNVTNTLIFERNGVKYLGFVSNMEVRVEGLITPLQADLVSVDKLFNIHDLGALLPISCLPDYRRHFYKYVKFIQDQGLIKAIMDDPRDMKVTFHKHNYAEGILVYQFYSRGNVRLNLQGQDFVLLGLWGYEASIYRNRLLRQLAKKIDITEFRKYSQFLSVFGSPHPSLDYRMDISENYLR